MSQIEKILVEIKSLETGEQLELLSRLLSTLYNRKMTLDYIQTIVCSFYGILPKQVQSRSRKQEIVFIRQLIMYFARKYTIYTTGFIGEYCGQRDHATVNYACSHIDELMQKNMKISKEIKTISALLKSNITVDTSSDYLRQLTET